VRAAAKAVELEVAMWVRPRCGGFETAADFRLRNDGDPKGLAYRFVAPISDADREPRTTRDAWRPADIAAEGIERESAWQCARADIDEIGRRPAAQPQRGTIKDAGSAKSPITTVSLSAKLKRCETSEPSFSLGELGFRHLLWLVGRISTFHTVRA
jgi:hypothetical protein